MFNKDLKKKTHLYRVIQKYFYKFWESIPHSKTRGGGGFVNAAIFMALTFARPESFEFFVLEKLLMKASSKNQLF